VKVVAEKAASEVGPEAQETAARLTALLRHLFLYDRGNQLRVIEDSGLSMTQCKALLELGGLGQSAETWQVGDLAEHFGVSVPSMSRAVDAMVKKGLATRVEDPEDRRVRQVKITGPGKDLVETLVAVRRSGIEAFAATLSAAQRRKLDAAVDSLMDREDIAQTYEHLKGSESA
ncbi:MAG TPA: MarR family transcriptional regulator, partial [Solirubrobacterales bacterium]|nr:MarR family transcriptional regulator [Solirubrobacterales bacterium]